MSTPDISADELAIEATLVAHLTAGLPGVHVLSAVDLESVEEHSQPTPAVHVIYHDTLVAEAESGRTFNGAHQVARQIWVIVVCVRNVRELHRGACARREAGPLISQVRALLSGWRPPVQGVSPLRRINLFRYAAANGFAYFPLAFEAIIATGD